VELEKREAEMEKKARHLAEQQAFIHAQQVCGATTSGVIGLVQQQEC